MISTLRRIVLCSALFLLAGALLTARASAQAPNDAAVLKARGDSAIVHQDWAALVATYEPVVKANPENGMAWLRYAAGLQALQRYPAAAIAFREAIRLQFQLPQAELRLARVFARLRRADSAVVHIERAARAGVAIEQITTEPDFDALRKAKGYVAVVDSLEALRYPCRSAAETRQFDFWIGDWAVSSWAGAAVTLGRQSENHISPELEHCVIHERWNSAIGGKGESINFWDPNRRAWRQIWMDSQQWSLDYEGEYVDGAMRFHGWTLGPDGKRRLEKLTFFNIAPDTVRQLFEQSADSGKTWRTTFDGRYVRMKSSKR